MNRKTQFWFKLMVVMTLLVVSLAPVACAAKEQGAYKKLVLREGIAHFSFEYPSTYDEPTVSPTGRFTSVVSGRKLTGANGNDPVLDIYVTEGGDLRPDAKTSLEKALNRYETEIFKDFKLIERSSITVLGVRTEQIVYTYSGGYPGTGISDRGIPAPFMGREVFFDYNGMVWNITISSLLEESETARADFEHILQTFKILK